VAHAGQKLALGLARRLGRLLGVELRPVGQRAVGDIADDDDDLAAVVGKDAECSTAPSA
jgi:hypothetical protein